MQNDNINNEQNFDSVENELRIVMSKLSEIDPSTSPEIFSDLDSRLNSISEFLKRRKNFHKLLIYIIAILLSLTISLVVDRFLDSDYKKELEDRLNNQIESSNKKDSLFDKYLGVDSAGNYTTKSVKGKVLSYRELDKSRDSLVSANLKLSDSLSSVNQKLELAKKNFGIYYTQTKIGGTYYISVGSKKIEQMNKEGEEEFKKMKPLLDSLKKY